jgi:uncharacterized membrane protein YdjX (TVP38/TMEM64 family)
MSTSNRRIINLVKGTVIVVAIVGLVSVGQYFNIQEVLRGLLEWISDLGTWGAIIFVLAYIFATILFLPGLLLTLGAGFLFGVVKGTAIVSLASTLGAGSAFLIGRYYARDWVAGKIRRNRRFRQVDEAVGREGWRMVGLVRLSPVFPFNLLNYAFGLTKVPFKEYLLASWIGMLPATTLYVYFGSLAGDLASLGSGVQTRTPAEWGFYSIGLVATLLVTVSVTRIARNALQQKVA